MKSKTAVVLLAPRRTVPTVQPCQEEGHSLLSDAESNDRVPPEVQPPPPKGPSATVHLTRIYTRTGDDGRTGLADFKRIPKDDARIVAFADCDETNSVLGLARAIGQPSADTDRVLLRLQHELFDAGADLATPGAPTHRIDEAHISALEADCDAFNTTLSALNSFVLPGGTPSAALLHQARTVCRRAERSVWTLVSTAPAPHDAMVAKYLNRMSDLLFILARAENAGADVLWSPAPTH